MKAEYLLTVEQLSESKCKLWRTYIHLYFALDVCCWFKMQVNIAVVKLVNSVMFIRDRFCINKANCKQTSRGFPTRVVHLKHDI